MFFEPLVKMGQCVVPEISISLDGASLEIPGGGGTEAQISKGYGSKKSSVFPEGPFASML